MPLTVFSNCLFEYSFPVVMGQESERKLASCDWGEDEFLGGNFLAAIQF